MINRRGQVVIYVIIAIIIVGIIVSVVLLRGRIGGSEVPSELQGVYDYYQGCIEDTTKIALGISGTQGGRIDTGAFIPGSDYAPFSNKLNFLGFSVPYWYYVSGNGLIKENVPTQSDVEKEIGNYVSTQLTNCNFDSFREQGYSVSVGDVKDVRVVVKEGTVKVDVNSQLVVSKGNSTATKSTHSAEVQSKFGKFYRLAMEIYSKEKKDAFLENYSVDILRLNAPVDGVEIQCSPKIWKTQEVVQGLKDGLEGNIASLKFNGNYYTLNDDKDKYFVIDKGVDESVNLIYSKEWPSKIEIVGDGVDDNLMVAEPVGTQEGMGVMGFCYVPYHYVYDVSYPVMVQVYDGEDIFQFPVVVVIDNNEARKFQYSGDVDYLAQDDFDLCQYRNTETKINLYDSNLNAVNGQVSYECFNQKCLLGDSKNGVYTGAIPSCVNGYIDVKVEGFAEKKQLFSSNAEAQADVILDRENEVQINVKMDGQDVKRDAVVLFTAEDGTSVSAYLPDVKSVKLKEGNYKIKTYVYSNSSIVIPESTKTECRDVPRSGIAGIFGGTKEECFDIKIPSVNIDYALVGGGQSEEYLLESELQKGSINIFANGFGKPKTIEELQTNYEAAESTGLEVGF